MSVERAVDYPDWVRRLLRAHRASQGHGRRASGCWACDVLPAPLVTESDRQRCRDLSRGAPASVGGFDGHHVIPKQVLKREFPRGAQCSWREWGEGRAVWVPVPREGPDAVWVELVEMLVDVRNGVPLRRWHHDQWENGRLVVPRGLIPASVQEFALEHEIDWWLDRTFGPLEAGSLRP